MEKEASEAYSGVVEEHEGAVSFRYSAFQSLPRGIQWRVLRRCFSGLAGDRESPEEKDNSHLDQAYQMLIQPPASFLYKFPGGVCLEKRYDQVSLGLKRTLPVPPFEAELSVPGRTFVKEIGKAIVSAEIGKDELPEQFDPLPHVAYLDYQRLEFPLILRNFRPGDRFQPLGVRGTQKLKEFFIDHKVPRFERATIPLVVSGGEIVWVVGHRISEKVKITDHTLRILRVEAV